MKNHFFVIYFFFISMAFCGESEFLIEKKNIKNNEKINESVIETSWKILKAKTKLDSNSIEINKFLLDIIESGFDDNKKFEQEFLDELILFKKDFEQKIKDLEKRIKLLKKKYKSNINKESKNRKISIRHN